MLFVTILATSRTQILGPPFPLDRDWKMDRGSRSHGTMRVMLWPHAYLVLHSHILSSSLSSSCFSVSLGWVGKRGVCWVGCRKSGIACLFACLLACLFACLLACLMGCVCVLEKRDWVRRMDVYIPGDGIVPLLGLHCFLSSVCSERTMLFVGITAARGLYLYFLVRVECNAVLEHGSTCSRCFMSKPLFSATGLY